MGRLGILSKMKAEPGVWFELISIADAKKIIANELAVNDTKRYYALWNEHQEKIFMIVESQELVEIYGENHLETWWMPVSKLTKENPIQE